MHPAASPNDRRPKASRRGFAFDAPSYAKTPCNGAKPTCSWTELPSRGHFCLDLHVAMQFRPYHHPSKFDGALVVVVEVSGKEPPNLLIVRTGQIFTTHVTTLRKGCDTNEYCQILGCPSIRREFYFTWLPMIRPILLRRPPQSNYPPDAVPDPDHGPRLESRHKKGGISRLTPHWLAPMLQSLPPILHKLYQNSTSSCSKGPRGLSVLMQLTSIFTRTSISPGLWLRQ